LQRVTTARSTEMKDDTAARWRGRAAGGAAWRNPCPWKGLGRSALSLAGQPLPQCRLLTFDIYAAVCGYFLFNGAGW
jgi:hypothetical protein